MDLTGSSILVLQYFRKCWSRKLCEPETDTAEQCAGLSPACSFFDFSSSWECCKLSFPLPTNPKAMEHYSPYFYATDTASLPNWSAISDLPSWKRFNGDVLLAWTAYIYLLVIELSTHNGGKMPTQWLSKLKQNGLYCLTSLSRRSVNKIKTWDKLKRAGLEFRSSRHFFFLALFLQKNNWFNLASVQFNSTKRYWRANCLHNRLFDTRFAGLTTEWNRVF